MKILNIPGEKLLKIMVIVFAGLFLFSFLASQIIDGLHNEMVLKDYKSRLENFNQLVSFLEHNTVDEKTDLSSDTAALGSYSNIIVTDSSGKVVYRINDNFMSEKDTFRAIPSTEVLGGSYYLIIDSSGKVRYTARLGFSYNRNPEKGPGIFGEWGLQSFGFGRNANTANNTNNTNVTMVDFAYIGTRDLYLYRIYNGSQGLNMDGRTNMDGRPESLAESLAESLTKIAGENVLKPLYTISAFIFWLLLPLWVYSDARKRDFKAALWSLLILLTNVAGLIVYMSIRPSMKGCIACGKPLAVTYGTCPYCGTQTTGNCHTCSSSMENEWSYCPFCGSQRMEIKGK